MADGGSPVNEVHAYFRGVDAALGLLEKRFAARPDLTGAEAIAEVERYHRVIRESLANVEATAVASETASPD